MVYNRVREEEVLDPLGARTMKTFTFPNMIPSGNLVMDPETGAIYRQLWTPLEELGDREWAGRERLDADPTPDERADYEWLVDLWEDGNRPMVI
jgi:hypothetical protein